MRQKEKTETSRQNTLQQQTPPRLQIGLFLPTRGAVMSGNFATAPLLTIAEFAEAAGLDSVWVGDSLLARPRFEPLTLLAALAARTRRVTLGTAVLLPPLRHPLLLAHSIATLDQLAEGRLVLGVGAGFNYPGTRRECEAVGVPFEQRVGRLVETISLCRRLWGDEPVTINNQYWTLDSVELLPKPYRPGGPPMWLGGNAAPALRRAGRLADGWFPTSATPDVFRQGWEQVQAAAQEAGRPLASLATATVLTVNLHADATLAQRELRQFLEQYYSAPYEQLATFIGCYGGAVDGCAELLHAFAAAGAQHIVLRFAARDQFAQLERVATDLLPQLQNTASVVAS